MKKLLTFIKKNWYAIELTIVCFLISIEVFPIWVAWAAIFLPAFGYVLKQIIKK